MKIFIGCFDKGPSSLLHIKPRKNGSSKTSQSGNKLRDNNPNNQNQYNTGIGRPNNKVQGPNYPGQRPPSPNQGEPSYQQGGPKQSQNQGGQGLRKPYRNGGPSYQQGGPKYNQNQGGQDWGKPNRNGGPPYQQGGQNQLPYGSNQGRQDWNQNQGRPYYQQGGPKQSPYYQNQGGQGRNQNQGRPYYQQGGPKQSPYYQNQGGQGQNQNQGRPSYQQGGQNRPPYDSNQRKPYPNQTPPQGDQKRPPSYPGQLPSQRNRQKPNRGGQFQDQKTGISDQTNNIPPSGGDKTRNNSFNDLSNKNNRIEPPTPSKTLSPLNTTKSTVVQPKPENNDNLGESPEVTGGPKESVTPFNVGLSDKGNLPPNVNDDHLWNNNPGAGKCDIILISVDIIP